MRPEWHTQTGVTARSIRRNFTAAATLSGLRGSLDAENTPASIWHHSTPSTLRTETYDTGYTLILGVASRGAPTSPQVTYSTKTLIVYDPYELTTSTRCRCISMRKWKMPDWKMTDQKSSVWKTTGPGHDGFRPVLSFISTVSHIQSCIICLTPPSLPPRFTMTSVVAATLARRTVILNTRLFISKLVRYINNRQTIRDRNYGHPIQYAC